MMYRSYPVKCHLGMHHGFLLIHYILILSHEVIQGQLGGAAIPGKDENLLPREYVHIGRLSITRQDQDGERGH